MTPQAIRGRIAEIKVSYSHKVPYRDRIQIRNSQQAYQVLLDAWDKELIDYQEQFYVLYLDRANGVKGIYHAFTGGTAACPVDIKQVLSVALKTSSSGILIAHNHPSGSMKFSKMDIKLTRRIKEACQVMDLSLLDHLLIGHTEYLSMADEGDL